MENWQLRLLPLDYFFLVWLIKLTDTVNNFTGQTTSGKLVESKRVWASQSQKLSVPLVGTTPCPHKPIHGAGSPFYAFWKGLVTALWLTVWKPSGSEQLMVEFLLSIIFFYHLVPSWKCHCYSSVQVRAACLFWAFPVSISRVTCPILGSHNIVVLFKWWRLPHLSVLKVICLTWRMNDDDNYVLFSGTSLLLWKTTDIKVKWVRKVTASVLNPCSLINLH